MLVVFMLVVVVVVLFTDVVHSQCSEFVGHWGQTLSTNVSAIGNKCCRFTNALDGLLSGQFPKPVPAPAPEHSWSELMLYWGYAVVGFDMGLLLGPTTGTPVVRIPVECVSSFSNFSLCNNATPKIDLGFIYGNTAQQEAAVRAGVDSCLLKMTYDQQFPESCDRDTLPAFTNIWLGQSAARCSADPRLALTPQVLAIHTLLANEHNRRCVRDTPIYPGLHYSVVKRQMITLVQKITMHEWLPAMLGSQTYADIIPPYAKRTRKELERGSRPYLPLKTSFEFSFVLTQLWTAGMSGNVQHQQLSGALTETGGTFSDFYDANALNRDTSGACNILFGSRATPMRKIGIYSLSQTWTDFQQEYYFYNNVCANEAYVVGTPTYAQALQLVSANNNNNNNNNIGGAVVVNASAIFDSSLLSLNITSLANLSALTDSAQAIAVLLNLTSAADVQDIDLYTGLLIESHNGDTLGAMSKYILASQLLYWRDNDADYFENLPNDGENAVYKNNLNNLLDKQCASFMQYKSRKLKTDPTESMKATSFDLLKENMQQMHAVDNSTDETIVVAVIVIVVFFLALTLAVIFYET